MSISWSDFFRPDSHTSNRSLKKFLEEEGLELGHRDLVLLRRLSESGVFLSYAALEVWAEGEVDRSLFEEVWRACRQGEDPRNALEPAGLCSIKLEEGVFLVGIEGECEPASDSEHRDLALARVDQGRTGSPLLAVYGDASPTSQPASGGAWSEERLQRDSLTLLDGESSLELVEAFRHLFRAAPSGSARASVVAAALSRNRPELDLEVSEKLEEVAPAFGQALRRLFEGDANAGGRALQFLLNSENQKPAPEWAGFWRQIRVTILESLARTERGTDILLRSIDHLAQAISGDRFLNHQLLDAFLLRLDELTPSQQDKLIALICDWAKSDSDNVPLLRSRLELTGEQNQRLLLGESLRRTYQDLEDSDSLLALSEIFVEEAVSAGSTAGSIALAELLRSFGSLVLDGSARFCERLHNLTERQTLNLLEVWELVVANREEFTGPVGELFLCALSRPAEHLSLLLKSDLLQEPEIKERFARWLAGLDFPHRHQVMAVGFKWSLTVENRPLLAECLRSVEWGFRDLWEGEWRRPHLSYQRLGWLVYCAPPEQVEFSPEIKDQLAELLKDPPTQPYFWELLRRCAGYSSFTTELREALLEASSQAFARLESGQEEERKTLSEVGAEGLRGHLKGQVVLLHLSEEVRSAPVARFWWISGLLESLYQGDRPAPAPPREIVSAFISRLISSGEQSMNELLLRALAAGEEEKVPTEESLPLQVSHQAYLALAAVASHQACPPALGPTIKRRLVLFLISWAKQLQTTTDPYSYRETPLFAVVNRFLADPALKELLRELAETFLTLHRKYPDKFRLEVRYAAQELFQAWSERDPSDPVAEGWRRALQNVSV